MIQGGKGNDVDILVCRGDVRCNLPGCRRMGRKPPAELHVLNVQHLIIHLPGGAREWNKRRGGCVSNPFPDHATGGECDEVGCLATYLHPEDDHLAEVGCPREEGADATAIRQPHQTPLPLGGAVAVAVAAR